MKSVRQRWASHKTYRRIQKVWQEYIGVVDKSDVSTISQKLNTFLNTFDEAYHEMIQAEQGQAEFSIEKLYGDCSEIMATLFGTIEREMSLKKTERAKCMQEPINKALVLINLILKEDKYQRNVTETPDFILRLLSLLEKPGSSETKVLLLRIISTIGESDRNKIEIAKLEGYKKILRLLITGDPELTQEVVRTVNYLLEFSSGRTEIADLALIIPGLKSSTPAPTLSTQIQSKPGAVIGFSPRSLLSRSSIQLTRPQSQQALPPRPKSLVMNGPISRATSPFDPIRRQSSTLSLRNMTSIDRVSQAISEVRGMFVQELGKIFPQLKDQDGLGILGMGHDDTVFSSAEKDYIPNAEQIQFTIAYYSQLIGQNVSTIGKGTTHNHPPPSESNELPEPSETHGQKDCALPPDKSQSSISADSSTLQRGRSLKKMVSTPDFRTSTKSTLEGRRNSEDRTSSEALRAARGAAVELAQEEEILRKSQPDNVLKEFMRTQGALRSLMAILTDNSASQHNCDISRTVQKHALSTGTRLATKIDIVETVCKVLFQNSLNQAEFQAMDGYSILLDVLDEIIVPTGNSKLGEQDSNLAAMEPAHMNHPINDFLHKGFSAETDFTDDGSHKRPMIATANKRSLLLGSLLAVFFDLALDGSTRDMVLNMDAYHFLFRLLLESKELDVRQHALYAIRDLISLNPLNAVAAWRCGEIDMVIGQLREYLRFRPTQGTLREAQWELGRRMGLDPHSINIRNVHFGGVTYFDNFVISEDTAVLAEMIEDGSPVYQYVVGLTRLLEYMSVMLIHDNVYVLYELSRLLMDTDFPDDSSVLINIVLRSVGRIVSDMNTRRISLEEKFASIYLQIVRRMLENQHTRREVLISEQDEQEQELRDCVHTEQRLLVLHVLGLVLKCIDSGVEVFEALQGFETLAYTILLDKRSCRHANRMPENPASYAGALIESSLCQDCYRSDIVASDLALWLFRDLALQDADNGSVISWIIVMLKATLSGIEELRRQNEMANRQSKCNQNYLHVQPEQQQDQAHALLIYLYAKICGTVSLIFRKSSSSKIAFGEAYGMQVLLSILSNTQHPDIATAALIAIGDFFAGYEGTRALLGDSFAYDGFLEIVLDSCRPLDKMSCEIVLEVATVGNVMSTKSRPHVESDSSIYCTEVWPFIASLLDPHLLFHSALPFTSPRKIGERNPFREPERPSSSSRTDLHVGIAAYQTNGRGTPSRPSSVYLDESLDVSNVGFTCQYPQNQSNSGTLPGFATSGNASAPSSNNNNRYSIFGISPWSNSGTPSISVSAAQEYNVNLYPTLEATEPNSEPAGTGSSRGSSMHLQRSGRSTPLPLISDGHLADDNTTEPIVSITSSRTIQPTKDKTGPVNRKRSNSRNLGGFGLNTTNLGLRSVIPSERMAFKQLAGIVFRDADAARMTLRLLGRIIECNNPKLAIDYFNLLMLLMEVTPRNKELLSQNNGLRFMLEILFRRGRQQEGVGMGTSGFPFLPRATDPPYVDLVPAMGAYDISAEDVKLLFDAVYDPLDMFFRLTAEAKPTASGLASTIKDSLGPLPELPSNFDKEPSIRRNSAGRPRSESASAATLYSTRRAGVRCLSANQRSFNGLQFNPLFIGEMEQQMMYAIEKISERVDPPCYFNFNGLNASLTTHPGVVERAVAAKGGYTVSVWIKVTAFLEKETGLFCYEEEDGNRTIFELYFKSLDQSNRYCLCVRTQHYPSPPEDFVFDRFDFAETGIWHHIVFVHHKTMKLMVDGCVIQSYGTFNQRRQEKEGGMVGVLGRKGRNSMSSLPHSSLAFNDGVGSINSSLSLAPQDVHQQFSASTLSVSSSNQQSSHSQGVHELSLGHFCGQAGRVHFLQGEWDQATAEKVYNLGPASTESWRALDIKSPVIAILDPEDFKRDMEKFIAEELSSTKFKDQPNIVDCKKGLTHGVLHGGCTIHMTRSMRGLIGQIGGIQLCFRFLEMTPSHLQLVGLRVISNLLYKSPENIAQFQNELNGYEIMYELLLNTASELSIDHFGVLFDIAINGMIKDEHLILSNMACVQLILRLLPSTMDSVQSYILRTLVDLIVESSENMRLWKSSFGMTTLFELFRTLPAHLRPFLMWTLESMMDGMTVQELGLLIGFIGHEEPDLFEVRRDIIEMLYKRMTTDHGLVDLLGSGLEGVTVLIGLLDSSNEHFRILILKMIGILLSDNTKSGKAALDKPNIGIGLIRSTLEKYPLSMDVIQVLLGLAQNSYRCDPNFRSTEKSIVPSSKKSEEKASIYRHSSTVVPSVTSSPIKESAHLTITPELNSNNLMNGIQDLNTQGSSQQSFEDPALARSESHEVTLHGSLVPRKHVYSNNANAPFVKMSALPTEPLIISSAVNTNSSEVMSISQLGRGGAKITDELTYASMIRLILELTGSLPHTDMVTHTLTDLKRLMTLENMRILWEAGWVSWVGAFMHDKAKVRVTSAAENLSFNRTMGVLDGMMQKMMIFDLSRKGSVTVRNKGTLVSRDEDVAVQLRLTEAALAWFDKNPNLDTEAANIICKGLVFLFRRLEELSMKFEEKQRQVEKEHQAEKARQNALEKERERFALEAVTSALNGVLDSLDDSSQSDESDSKSILLKADKGDTDAEELAVECSEDLSASSSSDTVKTPGNRQGLSLSGSISPTSSTSSTFSLPLSTLSANAAQSSMGQQFMSDPSEISIASRSHLPNHQSSHIVHQSQQHGYHHQYGRRHRSLQPRSSNIPTPPGHLDPISLASTPSHELNGSGINWPPLGLYDHFANCINNLACYNNSAIRAAMKSSGLFKIRDSLIEKLSKVEGSTALSTASSGIGAGQYSPYVFGPQHLELSLSQHIQIPLSSSSTLMHQETKGNNRDTIHSYYASDINCSASNNSNSNSNSSIAADTIAASFVNSNAFTIGQPTSKSISHSGDLSTSGRGRRHQSQQCNHQRPSFGMPSVI